MSPVEKILAAYKKHLWSILLFSFISNIIIFALPIYSLQVFDRVVNSGSVDTLVMLSIVVIVCFVAFGIIHLARALIISSTNSWIEKNIATDMLDDSIIRSSSGGNMAIGNHLRELGNIKSFMANHAINFFFDVPWSIVFLFVTFMIHLYVGIIVLVGCIIIFSLAFIYEKINQKDIDQSNEKFSSNIKKADEAANNSEAIMAMGMKKAAIDNWQSEHEIYLNITDKVGFKSATIVSFLKFIRFFLQVMVLGVGIYLVLQNEMTMGAVIATSVLASRAFAPFESSVMSWKSFVESRKSYHVLKEAFSSEKTKQSKVKLPIPKGVLNISKASYILEFNNTPIIKNITLDLKAGETLGIIGKNAAGKSTLLKLIAGILKPSHGELRLDGVDMFTALREGQIGKYIGYLPQSAQLFNASVADNITRLNTKNPDSNEIIRVTKMLGIHEMILRMPDGYDTKIGPEAIFLSAGQRQSIALARAFYGNPRFILLDEPNTSLDHNCENGLIKALKQSKKEKATIIIVSHTQLTLKTADKILALDNGEMKLFGPADQVIKKFSAV